MDREGGAVVKETETQRLFLPRGAAARTCHENYSLAPALFRRNHTAHNTDA